MISQIPIQMPEQEGTKEFTILELQGEFEFVEESQKVRKDCFENLILGQMRKAKIGGAGTYEVVIGNQCLKGKILPLDKPLLFTERLENKDSEGNLKDIQYEIKGVVKNKIVFSTRPTPVRATKAPVDLRRKLSN